MAARKKAASNAAIAESGPLAQVFGVRHLSPMGSWHLARFLETVNPTAVLIEGPSDATDLLQHLVHKKTRPPIAILAFTKARPVKSILFPMAEYSPEWVAATYALKNKRVVKFMDLPSSVFLGLQAEKAPAPKADGAKVDKATSKEPPAPDPGAPPLAPAPPTPTQVYLDDPYSEITRLSGDPDHDTWWERHFEHSTEPGSYREAIFEFGAGLRTFRTEDDERQRETLLREAYMRKSIRDTLAEGHDPSRVVVVCGAFHAPVLVGETPALTEAEDRAMPRLETSLTLMPYSYYRLSSQSGYGAGNHAPGYFQALWEETSGAGLARLPARYMSQVAAHLRAAGNVRSSAEVIEGVRLAHAVACLHEDRCAPTLRDLQDAAVISLGQGDRRVVQKALDDVEIGSRIGAVPPGVARTAIQDDFYTWLERLKLEDYLKDKEEDIKGSTGKDWLDLRENRAIKSLDTEKAKDPAAVEKWKDTALRDRRRSIFLHRLEALEIGFARDVTTAEDRDESTYKECWRARWTPECEINLAENSLRGDTIEIATIRRFEEQLAATVDVGEAAELASRAVKCDLVEAAEAARERVQQLAVDDASFTAIARATHTLSSLLRQTLVTRVNLEPLKPVVSQLFLRAAMLVPGAARSDDDAARKVGSAMADVNRVSSDWDSEPHPDDPSARMLSSERWHAALDAAADDDLANPFSAGVACALLLEDGLLTDEVLDRRVARRISPGMDPALCAGYFEGLASRNRMALLSRKKLWASLTAFLESLDDRAFKRSLVGLRRAFSTFEMGEVRRVAALLGDIWGGGGNELAQAVEIKIDAKEAAALEADLADLGDLDL